MARRRQLVLEAFAERFGPAALEATAYLDRDWSAEAHSAGCYAAIVPPGLWTTFGHCGRRPEGRVHWAGTETATHFSGYIEGALRSGERAAREVIASHV